MSNASNTGSVSQLKDREFNIVELSYLFDINRNTLSALFKAQNTPHNPGPKNSKLYKLSDVTAAISSQLHKTTNNSEQLKQQQAEVKLELSKIDLARKQGELVPISEVTDLLTAQYQTIREQLLSLGQSSARELAAATDHLKCAEIVDQRVNTILSFLSTEAFQELSEPATEIQEDDE